MKYDGHACSVDSVFGFWAMRARKDEDGRRWALNWVAKMVAVVSGFEYKKLFVARSKSVVEHASVINENSIGMYRPRPIVRLRKHRLMKSNQGSAGSSNRLRGVQMEISTVQKQDIEVFLCVYMLKKKNRRPLSDSRPFSSFILSLLFIWNTDTFSNL